MTIQKRLLTISEFAEYINFKKGSIYNLIQAGETLPGMLKIQGRGKKRPAIRFDREAVDRWIDSQVKGE